jgi:hypothetical protein
MTISDEDLRRKLLASAFQMPSVQTMVSRKSSITNAFVNAVIPVVVPTIEEIEQALAILGMDPANVRCAFCGDKSSEWDHLRPLVLNHRPTGYVSEIANLVPACGKCNQSKGNKAWRLWIVSNARLSPTGRKVANVADRIARLETYEKWRPPTSVDFEAILGREDWEKYWAMWKAVNETLRQCQDVAELLRKRVAEHLGGRVIATPSEEVSEASPQSDDA